MEHRDVFLLETIVDYCDRVAAHLRVHKMGEKEFLDNLESQDICAFYCLQIGENANSLSEVFITSHPEVEWRKIIDLRNIIAHEYGTIDASMLWGIVAYDIPELRKFCAGIIK